MIIQHSLFLPSPLGHGGNRRSAQINALIKTISPDLVVAGYDTPNRHSSKTKIALTLFRGLIEAIKSPSSFFLSPGLATLMNLGHLPSQLRSIAQSQNAKSLTIVWESTVPAMFGVIRELSRRGVRILAFPHNVEALSWESRNLRKMLRWMKFEAQVLGLCDEVICISPFDAWLYANLGVRASTLPYEITQESRTSFDVVASARQTSVKDTFLILGSSTNEPTRAGIYRLLEASANSDSKVRIAVVSRGLTLAEVNVPQHNKIEIFPDLSDSSLQEELVRARALIVQQDWGTGQLTRIHEAISMGIPVFGNELSARGYLLTHSEVPEAVSRAFPGCGLGQIVELETNKVAKITEVLSVMARHDFRKNRNRVQLSFNTGERHFLT